MSSTALFTPFQLPAKAQLSDRWLDWLGIALTRGDSSPIPEPPADWAEVLPVLEAHRLSPLLYTRLRDHAPLESAEFLAPLARAFRASVVRSLRIEAELDRILARLAATGVRCLLLKGAALGKLVYASLAERPVSDLDLLVPRECLAQAAEVLTGLGYQLRAPSARGRIGRWFYRYRAELPAVGASVTNQGLLVELHWSLAELPYYMERIDMAEVWENARPLPVGSDQVPDPAVLLLHACAHLALHHSRDLRLIWLVDLDRLARSGPDWERVVTLAERWRLGYATMASLTAATRWLDTPLPSSVVDALAVLAEEPVGRAMWGLGDEALPGRWWRRAWATWIAFEARQRARYAGWLALRVLLSPAQWLNHR